ncbi:MAG: NifU family protein [Flavobacteriales bacterium]|nr:NifU family protein [Flavobacteriales bacterium]|tara:strand:- start:5077 stop:5697 length:621 start_codon:yes stop_codon:yes gene_type:complete
MSARQVPITVYAEMTPNPEVMKFVTNKVLNPGAPLDFSSSDDASGSPLAEAVLNFPFVENVFISNNFIAVTKNDVIEWDMVVMETRNFISDYLRNDKEIIKKDALQPHAIKEEQLKDKKGDEVKFNVATNDLDEKIIDALNEYIRPAVENDGGSIDFVEFKDGIVKVALRGACSGCPSSTVTLKQGIEGLLKRMFPEVNEVEAVSL